MSTARIEYIRSKARIHSVWEYVDPTKELEEIKALIPPVEPTPKNYKELAGIPEPTPRPRNMPSRETTSTASIQTESRAGTPPLEQALVLSNGTVPHTSVERQDLGIMISLSI
ncbi:hypothetical protein V496_03914 [Pseudogymnoascus sp. VKM F-4515 (FW-2607)]|nr:hypothetical protein V496_03914 [Pseudogymnoascus sp. VKM F-4515 (FW-2607)]KFY82317.1 hypothetical protein V498_08624 [Pseudogymnoascus sp. VKM F-4517 (FW-2822)]